ncbi:small lysine-rich protein 1 [Topomyia yanbarensis]|uniref:small lysine-rich protein 1 n=1 Tax=Topomyia yanbarensis TaxID=2498891 RepID=UPI00273B6D91|nr:small lysine-rich protein 1 [Topomyia yanbarensis]
MPGKGKKKATGKGGKDPADKSSGASGGGGEDDEADEEEAEVKPKKGRGKKGKGKGGKSSKFQGDLFSEAAMENAYYVCHNIQDVLKSRGFAWPDGQKKKKKGKK